MIDIVSNSNIVFISDVYELSEFLSPIIAAEEKLLHPVRNVLHRDQMLLQSSELPKLESSGSLQECLILTLHQPHIRCSWPLNRNNVCVLYACDYARSR